ncbi:MAG: ComF family protein [Spirochaetaceae bacterium]|nr:ComF family protein [Spirochaetaceae bacterium]
MKSLLFILKHKIFYTLYNFFSLFSPLDFCILCKKECGDFFCKNCHNQLRKYISITNRCSLCGRILLSEKGICMYCRRKTNQRISVCALFPYALWMKDLVFQWKEANLRKFSYSIAHFYYETIKEKYSDYVIVPIPPRPKKIFALGWDQMNDIANYLKYYFHCDVQKLLKRTENFQQKKLSKEERLYSKNKYVVKNENMTLPKKILLIDDIMTTGATIESCGILLKNKGATEVCALVLCGVD